MWNKIAFPVELTDWRFTLYFVICYYVYKNYTYYFSVSCPLFKYFEIRTLKHLIWSVFRAPAQLELQSFFYFFFCLSPSDLSPFFVRFSFTERLSYIIILSLYYFCVLCWFVSFLRRPPAELSKCLVSNCYCTPVCVCVCARASVSMCVCVCASPRQSAIPSDFPLDYETLDPQSHCHFPHEKRRGVSSASVLKVYLMFALLYFPCPVPLSNPWRQNHTKLTVHCQKCSKKQNL